MIEEKKSSPKKRRLPKRVPNSTWLLYFIGAIGHKLVLQLLGGRSLTFRSDVADIIHHDLKAAIEVKTNRNNGTPPVFLSQLDKMIVNKGFPGIPINAWYAFAVYGDGSSSKFRLSDLETPEEVVKFLVESLAGIYLIDTDALDALAEIKKTNNKLVQARRASQREEALLVGPRTFRELCDPESPLLGSMGDFEFRGTTQKCRVCLHGSSKDVLVSVILPKRSHDQVWRTIQKRQDSRFYRNGHRVKIVRNKAGKPIFASC